MKRPLRKRIWFYKPWPGYLKPDPNTFLPKGWWKPWGVGGDEFDWHTIVIGHPVIGQIVFATRPCPRTGKCAEEVEAYPESWRNEWPIDMYGHNHEGPCANPDCYCKENA